VRRWAGALLCASLLIGADRELRLVVVDPVHFHAAQFHTNAMPGFSRDARVYAPVGRELARYLESVSNLRSRSAQPDHWRFHIYAGSDFFDRMLAEKAGDVMVLSGRNWKNIDYIGKAVANGMHVLADKPWIIDAAQFPALKQAFATAASKGVIAYDCMTQRFDIAYLLQRELVNDPEVFGSAVAGTPEVPSVEMASTHFLLKRFNGVVNLRPAAYFDIRQQGEAFADVGTHVVDLAHWTLFRDQALDYKKDFRILQAKRWPTILSLEDFTKVTGERAFPPYLEPDLRDGKLHYFTNNEVIYSARGHVIKASVTWDFESPSGANDTMLALYRGAKSEILVRQSAEEKYVPELYITPKPEHRASVLKGIDRRLAKLASKYPGLTRDEGKDGRIHIVVPKALRIPDIEYFLMVSERFAGYVRKPETMPSWETPNMLAKYWVTTQGVKAAKEARP
jgi:predicted dehydrogenase